ncbi:TIGR01777 family protein [Streptomyces pluripotens]|uniref:TIGR01777 family protein n=1 Tax=Streptomyces pluripotens TaxID=1355015 RepID=A0A221P6V7_9ACTN|nr:MULTISPECIES: TIGR01777 family oxidoreductase [Streptomyces]ARP73700.1 TIGR01777 family protein [Streptomyces pluripotens]ASN27947.1 TIGR01777 family protein [Streptomyces pluripotens]KIE24341.1 epimerase [Streptomyces sp. MUSC 125]MCH0559443.1 TIGR01777 family protein [Streptomyces sp. MUM 16J]
MRVAITGSNGLIGSALTRSLLTDGHQVVRLVRNSPAAPGDGSESAHWDPLAGHVQPGALDGVDAVVHLAGAGIGDKRWTATYKREIRSSRVRGTATIARACAESEDPPRVLVSASATGHYGDTGARTVDETGPAGDDFLASVCVDWEAAAHPARRAGIRVVHPRTGLVVSTRGGAFGRLFPLFRLGIGGRLGSGDQYWPIVSLTDHIAALRFVLASDALCGPVNFTAPEPPTNREVTRAMSHVLGRPAPAPVPAFALRVALGEFAASITCSARVVPAALLRTGFVFRHPTVEEALDAVLRTSD